MRRGRKPYNVEQVERIFRFMVDQDMPSLSATAAILRDSPEVRETYGIRRVPSQPTLSRRMMVTACARCGHGWSHHYREYGKVFIARNPKTCRDCDCERYVQSQCEYCEHYCFSPHRCCAECWRMGYGNYCEINPERQIEKAERELVRSARREELKWLRDGKKTLSQIRELLRA